MAGRARARTGRAGVGEGVRLRVSMGQAEPQKATEGAMPTAEAG